jgi:plastocyanin
MQAAVQPLDRNRLPDLADGAVQFESGTLGSAVPPATGALEWRTPPDLRPGTYTYFCRIHPFMRGAFRVKE